MARQTRLKTAAPAPRRKAGAAKPTKAAVRTTSRATSGNSRRPKAATASAPKASAKVERGSGGAPQLAKDAKASQLAQERGTPPPRKPGYYEALAMYENGVRALQRHDYQGAAAQFRSIIERYPEERELQERSHLYLRVCERETARRPPTPQTPQERVYAATVALNAGDTPAALDHLRRALSDAPDSDHAHYIMCVALVSKGDPGQAFEHLRQAISLNPENRALAMQDPDLEPVRAVDEFRELLDAPASTARSKARKKR